MKVTIKKAWTEFTQLNQELKCLSKYKVIKQEHHVVGEPNENSDKLNGRQSHAIVHKEELLKLSKLIYNLSKSCT